MATRSDLCPAFQSFSVIEERLANNVEIDCEDVFGDMPGLEDADSDSDDEEDTDHNDPDVEADDIQNIYADGLDFKWTECRTNLPHAGPPEGYNYTPFIPKDAPREFAGHICVSPTIQQALAALADLKPLIRPKRQTGTGYRDPELDLWTRARLEGMQSMLLMYTDSKSRTYDNWGASSCQTAIEFIKDQKILPINPFGDWNKSMLADENLRNKISIFLLSIGNKISAKKLMDFLAQPDVREKFGI
ncbi:hypothetical protein B0H34DRAFT_800130 [Crassisporium funariophilum]|nr:hypothetical protein B0H34DRAFT_800130 [Crassisporium funariophilum]